MENLYKEVNKFICIFTHLLFLTTYIFNFHIIYTYLCLYSYVFMYLLTKATPGEC